MDIEMVYDTLKYTVWDRMFLHARAATGGSINALNTHGFREYPYLVMHNGFISAASHELEVDSEQIGKWIREDGVFSCLTNLYRETYANVFLIDVEAGDYYIHRSKTNTLFTDGVGSFSTGAFGDINIPVDEYSQQRFRMKKWGVNSWKRYSYSNWNSTSTSVLTDDFDYPTTSQEHFINQGKSFPLSTQGDTEDKGVAILDVITEEERQALLDEDLGSEVRYRPMPDSISEGYNNEFLQIGDHYYFEDQDIVATYEGYSQTRRLYEFTVEYSNDYDMGVTLLVDHKDLDRIVEAPETLTPAMKELISGGNGEDEEGSGGGDNGSSKAS
jgi:hypothetical protein